METQKTVGTFHREGSMIGQQCWAGFIRDIYFIPRGGSDCKLGVQEEGSGIDIWT